MAAVAAVVVLARGRAAGTGRRVYWRLNGKVRAGQAGDGSYGRQACGGGSRVTGRYGGSGSGGLHSVTPGGDSSRNALTQACAWCNDWARSVWVGLGVGLGGCWMGGRERTPQHLEQLPPACMQRGPGRRATVCEHKCTDVYTRHTTASILMPGVADRQVATLHKQGVR